MQLQRMFRSYCRLRLVAVLIFVSVLATASLFCVFLNEELVGGVPSVGRIQYKPKLQQSVRKPVQVEHLETRNLSNRVKKVSHGYSKFELYHNVEDPLSIPRNKEYCNLPIKNVTGEEGEVGAGYQLVSVQVMIRHGTRSPMYSFPNHSNPPLSCEFHPAARSNTLIRSFLKDMKLNGRRVSPKNPFFKWLLYPQRKTCGMAELLPSGTVQHLLNGFYLRDRYVRRWQLFGGSVRGDKVSVVSTLYSRTYQSAVAFLYGLLPHFDLSELSILQSANFFCDEHVIHYPCVCPAQQKLKERVNVESLQFNKNNTRLFKLQKLIGEVFGLSTHQLPNMWAMTDVFMGYVCNKVKPLPCNSNGKCIRPWVVSELWDLVEGYGVKLNRLKSYQLYTRITMYPFLVKVLEQMILSIKNKTKVKFSLFSGHDTTITPLAVSLGIGDGKWPNLASRIVFELYSEQGRKDRHYIKVLFNGKNVTPELTFCRGHAFRGLCKFKHFSRFVREDILQGQTYTQICHGKL